MRAKPDRINLDPRKERAKEKQRCGKRESLSTY